MSFWGNLRRADEAEAVMNSKTDNFITRLRSVCTRLGASPHAGMWDGMRVSAATEVVKSAIPVFEAIERRLSAIEAKLDQGRMYAASSDASSGYLSTKLPGFLERGATCPKSLRRSQ